MEPCTQCGNPYERSRYRNASPFCSAACRNRAARGGSTSGRKPQEWLACTECGAKVRKERGSAQPDRVRCRACRKASVKSGPHPCPDCGAQCWGECCRACRAKRQTVSTGRTCWPNGSDRAGVAPTAPALPTPSIMSSRLSVVARTSRATSRLLVVDATAARAVDSSSSGAPDARRSA